MWKKKKSTNWKKSFDSLEKSVESCKNLKILFVEIRLEPIRVYKNLIRI